jgi:ketosteroid isomerase-like protein
MTIGLRYAVEEVSQAEERLRLAMLEGDTATLDELLTDQMNFTNQAGVKLTKQDDLAAHRSGLLKIEQIEPEDRNIRVLGTIAIVTQSARLAGSFDGQPFAGIFAYTRIWAQTGDRWRVEAGHCSALT